MKRRSLALLVTLLLVLGLSGCGGSSGKNAMSGSSASYAMDSAAAEMDYGGYWAEAAETPMAPAEKQTSGSTGGDSRSTLPDGVKMIYRANLELETTEYEAAQNDIRSLTQQLGGYFENQSSNSYTSNYRSSSYTIRVPAEQFETFLHQIGQLCRVRYQSQSAEDVSEYYYDMESRLETAKIKLDRLQELLTKAETMEDIITLEGAISDVEYQIESLSGELRHYDALIGYSTIYVTLNEVYRVTEEERAPLTFGERMGVAFREGLRDFGENLEDFAEWLAYSWLGILVFVLILVAVIKLIRRLRAKKAPGERKGLFRRKDKAAATEEKPEP